ncbi:MAG TPA: YbaY family lipoprotein [Casimicrobiaceae bacterium]|nr:YbaY family lipoprotein [Casimicrobiaceae bacterium]
MKRALLLVLSAMSLGPDFALSQANSTAAVSGTVTYRQRVALPPDAIVQVQLQDMSRADSAARTIGETTIPTAGAQAPIPYRIEYDPSAIDPSHGYAVRATITVGDRLLFASTKVHPVLTRGAGNDAVVEVFMILPGASAGGVARRAIPLENTPWTLVSLVDMSDAASTAGPAAGFVLQSAGHRLSGFGGCSRLVGSYDLGADTIKLAPSGTTMLGCPRELMDRQKAFISALSMATGYRVSGNTLELRNGERVLARFTAQQSK